MITKSEERIARRVVELLQDPAMTAAQKDSDPWLTREQAARYLNFSPSSFERARRVHAEALKPCEKHPLRWSKNALDAFKLRRGVLPVRRGRRRAEGMAA